MIFVLQDAVYVQSSLHLYYDHWQLNIFTFQSDRHGINLHVNCCEVGLAEQLHMCTDLISSDILPLYRSVHLL